MSPAPHLPFAALLVPWLLFAVGGSMFFYRGGNGALKRRLWPAHVISVFVLFALVLQGRDRPTPGWFYAVLGAALVACLRAVRFCDACGEMVSRARGDAACPRCGAPLAR